MYENECREETSEALDHFEVPNAKERMSKY